MNATTARHTRDLLGRYYGLLAEQRFADAAALFRDDGEVLWSIPGTGPLAGTYDSKEAIEQALRCMDGGRYGEVKRPIHAFCLADDGEHVCAQYLLRMTRGEEHCDVVAIDAWHIHDGKLAEVWTFFETLYDFDAWTGKDR
jgi:ketosteroid isomerase-like protein